MNRVRLLILVLVLLQLIQLAEPKKGSKALTAYMAKNKLHKRSIRCFNVLKNQKKQSRSFQKCVRDSSGYHFFSWLH